MTEQKKEFTSYFENMSLFVIGLLLLIFPVLFLASTTDAFVFPKEIALAFATTLFVLFFCLKTIAEGKLKLRTSPFNLPVTLFLIATFLSAVFSVNRYDALIAFVPLLFAVFLYFGLVNLIKGQKQLLFILSCLVLGAVLSSLITILSFFHLYPMPFSYTHVAYFTTFGSLLDQAIYLALILPVSGYFVYSLLSAPSKRHAAHGFAEAPTAHSKNNNQSNYFFAVGFILNALSLGITLFMLFTSQKPLILPLETGLQTGLAAISQDSGRFFQGLLFGSGFGTYLIDFTRFKQASYNLSDTLWSFTFFRSSNFILELLATTGVLGVLTYLFLVFKIIKERNFFLPLILAVIASIILPFSFTILTLFFVLLGLFAVIRIHSNPDKHADLEFQFVALQHGLFAASPTGERVVQTHSQKIYNKLLPIFFLIFMIIVIGVPVFWSVKMLISDVIFQQSLVAASQNNGKQTYDLEISSISMFPYRDIYYRAFSQTNLALANALAQSQSGTSPSAQMQQNITTLIQQAITSGRTAVTVAPLTSFNWNNLSSIYRSLIGFGQNADRFTVLSSQQALALDPNNPQQYLDLGGIYYQLGLFDDANRQFQTAINLKNNYANAYYNLGHTLESKGDLQGALAQYQIVKGLVTQNPDNYKKITAEINALQDRINKPSEQSKNSQQSASSSAEVQPNTQDQQPLTVNEPPASLPERNPKVKIPGPTVTVAPEPTKADATPSTQP